MNGCCIVETRPLANLDKLIIDRHLKFIPKDWELTIYCSELNHHLVKGVNFGRNTNIIVLDNPIMDNTTYNLLLKSVTFWGSLPYDKVLIFQADSGLLREGIEEFLEWDYVGAAWLFQNHGGNGGLSLRSVELMKHICENYSFSTRNEDVLFCNLINDEKIGKLAPREICKKFSVETIFGLGSLGYHAMDKYLTKRQCDEILNQYNNSHGI